MECAGHSTGMYEVDCVGNKQSRAVYPNTFSRAMSQKIHTLLNQALDRQGWRECKRIVGNNPCPCAWPYGHCFATSMFVPDKFVLAMEEERPGIKKLAWAMALCREAHGRVRDQNDQSELEASIPSFYIKETPPRRGHCL